jgi:hypothetical protein
MKKAIISLMLLSIFCIKINAVQAMAYTDSNTGIVSSKIEASNTTFDTNNSQKEIVDLDKPENEQKYNIRVGGSFRIDPFISGFQTKTVYVTSVYDTSTAEVYDIPDNVVFKKTLNIYKYVQPCKGFQFTDFTMLISNTEFVGQEVMTFSKEKRYWLKEYSLELPNTGYIKGLCFIRGTVPENAILDDGQYMDGGATKAPQYSIGSKGGYDRTKTFIPWDEVDKDPIVKKYINSHYDKDEALTTDDEYSYESTFNNYPDNGIYKVKKNTDEKTKLAAGDGDILRVDENYIYYTISSDDYKLNRMKKDGSEKTYLGVNWIRNHVIQDGWLYFTTSTSDTKISKVRLDGTGLTTICNDHVEDYFGVYGDYIYYQNYNDNYKLYKVKTDGTGRQKVSDLPITYVSVENDHIYYLYDHNFYKMNLDGTNSELLYDPTSTKTNTNTNINTNTVTGTQIKNTENSIRKSLDRPNYIKKSANLHKSIKANSNAGQVPADNNTTTTTSTNNELPKPTTEVNKDTINDINGNLYNGGYYVKQGDWIYYSNNGICKLNTITGEKEVIYNSSSICSKIHIDGDWLYFTSSKSYEGYETVSLYKIKTDGTDKTFVLNLGRGSLATVFNNDVYYFEGRTFELEDISKADTLYKKPVDGDSSTEITSKTILRNFSIEDGYMYYATADSKNLNTYMAKVNLSTLEKTLLKTNSYLQRYYFTYDNWIYYIDNQKNLKRMKTDGTNDTIITKTDNNIWTLNVQGDWIYYSLANDLGKLYKIKNDGTQKTVLSDGQIDYFYNISIIDDYIYTKHINKAYKYVTWQMKTDGTDAKIIDEK